MKITCKIHELSTQFNDTAIELQAVYNCRGKKYDVRVVYLVRFRFYVYHD